MRVVRRGEDGAELGRALGADLEEAVDPRRWVEPPRSEVQRLRELQLLEVDALECVLSLEEVRKRPREDREPGSSWFDLERKGLKSFFARLAWWAVAVEVVEATEVREEAPWEDW